MKPYLIIASCLLTSMANAQKTVDVGTENVNALSSAFFSVVGGQPFAAKFTRLVSGSPYLNDNWTKGSVTLEGGKEYTGLDLRLDLYENKIHFKNAKGEELVASSAIQKVTLTDSASGQQMNFVSASMINSNTHIDGWYQVIADGKAAVAYKKYEKRLIEDRDYGSATVDQSIVTFPHYYILTNGNFKEVKKFKEIPDMLASKKDEVAKYIKDKSLSGKSDDDYKNLITYFNGLN